MQLTAPTLIINFVVTCTIVPRAQSFQVSLLTKKISAIRCWNLNSLLPPWHEVEIDYSAANEYVHAHYGEQAPSKPYFRRCVVDDQSSTKSTTGKCVEPIYNARNGVYDHNLMRYQPASLPICGFSLCHSPSNVTDWSDINQIKHHYLQELETTVIPSSFPDSQLKHIAFWNPMLRGEDYVIQRNNNDEDDDAHLLSTSNIASMVHIDTDIGAFESLEELVSMVENNRFDDGTSVKREDIIECISGGHRFSIVNFWRNIDPTPIERAPLAMLYAKYSSSTASKRLGSFPHDSPDPMYSRWYTYPSMTNDECLLFLQYDRLLSQPSDLWHCALPSVGIRVGSSKDRGSSSSSGGGGDQEYGVPRRSFDVRALVVFQEKVPAELDRFSPDRLRPMLSLEESGCFCEDQAASRV